MTPTPPRARTPRERAVVTGLGAVTPIGLTAPSFWDALLAGRSGAAPIKSFDASSYDTTFACELKDFDPLIVLDRKQVKRLDPVFHYAIVACDEALRDAGLSVETMPDSQRTDVAVVFGSAVGGIQTFQAQCGAFTLGGHTKLSPFFIPMIIPDMVAGVIAMQWGFRGPNHCVVSACATGNHNIGGAASLIREGEAEVVLCGASEAAICGLSLGGFSAMRALSTRNDDPQAASRPFDMDRDGFVLGEGAGALVLESLAHAESRGARIYAEVLSVGASADAHHITAPHPEGAGARLAMERALKLSRIRADEVDSINMHGTSTPLGDTAESRAVRNVFGAHADCLTATSTKSMTGHMFGAAGAAEAVATVLSIAHGVVPPTINFHRADPSCDLRYAFNAPERRTVKVAMSNSFGFGGHNTSAIFAALPE